MVTSHLTATPQSDVVRICAHDFQRHGNAFGTTESACSRAFIILRSHFHLHDCSERTLTEIVSKITPKPWTCPLINIQNPNRADFPVSVTVCKMIITFILY